MQAALSSVISSEGALLGVSSSVELSAEEDEEPLVILEKKLERTGVTGTLFVAGAFEGVFLDDGAVLAVSALEILGLDGVSFSFSFSFEEELFFVFGDLGGSVLDRESFGGALSGNAPIGVAVFEDEDFAGGGFDAEGFGAGAAAAFTGAGFDVGAGFGVGAAAFGDGGFAAAAFGGGAPLGMVTFGGGWFICAAGGCAVNCPLAICRARSFTLRNILSDSDGMRRNNLGAIDRFDANRQPRRSGHYAHSTSIPKAYQRSSRDLACWVISGDVATYGRS
jgi:hypothetical protein